MKKTAANKKVHDRQFDAGGKLLRETRGYLEANGSRLAILLMREYKAGRVIGETDIVKGRVVSRRSYDKARVNFPPMPAPNTSIEDRNARLLRTMAAERRSRHDAAKAHVRHRQRGRDLDGFCRKLMREGASADAVAWVKERDHTLGEMDEPASRRLVARLVKLGCVAITACKIDRYDNGLENTGHVVVELPASTATRGKILRALARLSEHQGYTGDADDGQRYC